MSRPLAPHEMPFIAAQVRLRMESRDRNQLRGPEIAPRFKCARCHLGRPILGHRKLLYRGGQSMVCAQCVEVLAKGSV